MQTESASKPDTDFPGETVTTNAFVREALKAASTERDLLAALKEIEIICTESASACRKRMGTRVGNCIVVARAGIARAEA